MHTWPIVQLMCTSSGYAVSSPQSTFSDQLMISHFPSTVDRFTPCSTAEGDCSVHVQTNLTEIYSARRWPRPALP
jgi:hypothetical protein